MTMIMTTAAISMRKANMK